MGALVKINGDAGRWYSHLTLGLQTLRSSNALCDASLVSQDGHMIPVHSVVMAAGSSVLETLMKSNRNDDNDENHVFLDDVTSGSVLTSIVDFVYTASCDVSKKHLDELCSVARALKLYHLQELCVSKFKGIDFNEACVSNNNNDEKTLSKNSATTSDSNSTDNDNDGDDHGDGKGDDDEEEVKNELRISDSTKDRLRQALHSKHSLPAGDAGDDAMNAEGDAEMEEEQGVYVCKFCSKMFPGSEQLQRHEYSEHQGEDENHDDNHAADNEGDDHDVSDNDAEVSNLMTTEERRLMTSKSSGFFFDDSSDGVQNIPDFIVDEDSNLSASLPGVVGARSPRTPGGAASISPSSASKFAQAQQQQTQSKKRFFCDLCDSSFTRRDNLKTHKKAKHEGQQPFDCPKCGR